MSLLYENVFGESTRKEVGASKRPVAVGCGLRDEAGITDIHGATVFTGTKIKIIVTLHEKSNGYSCKNPDYYPESTEKQPVDVYHRVAGGAWTKIFTVTTSVTADNGYPAGCGANKYYTIMGVGTHEFYAKYNGNEYLEGCGSKVVKSLARSCNVC